MSKPQRREETRLKSDGRAQALLERRRALQLLAGAAAAPVLSACGAGDGPARAVAARVGELKPNSAKMFRLGRHLALLIHTASGEYRAVSADCTHERCTIIYNESRRILLCNCHNGRFDLDGRVISGPPPLPLPTFQVEVQGQEIVVSEPSGPTG